MGIFSCCNRTKKLIPNGKRLFRIRVNTPNQEISFLNEFSTSFNLNHFCLHIYDIDQQRGYQKDISLSLLKSLEGISQIEYNDIIYLCGNQTEENLSSSSSFLISINPYKSNGNMNILLSSIAHHYYPSLIGLRNDLIVVIGGNKQTTCEHYSISQEKWKEIAKLPDGRYQASLLYDKASEVLYLFGGYNHLYNKCNSTILCIETKYFSNWDTILVKSGKELIERSACGVMFGFNEGNSIIIFGGKNSEGMEDDKVIEYNVKKRTAKVVEGVLMLMPACFALSSGNMIRDMDNGNGNANVFMLDDKVRVYKLSKIGDGGGQVLSITKTDFINGDININI